MKTRLPKGATSAFRFRPPRKVCASHPCCVAVFAVPFSAQPLQAHERLGPRLADATVRHPCYHHHYRRSRGTYCPPPQPRLHRRSCPVFHLAPRPDPETDPQAGRAARLNNTAQPIPACAGQQPPAHHDTAPDTRADTRADPETHPQAGRAARPEQLPKPSPAVRGSTPCPPRRRRTTTAAAAGQRQRQRQRRHATPSREEHPAARGKPLPPAPDDGDDTPRTCPAWSIQEPGNEHLLHPSAAAMPIGISGHAAAHHNGDAPAPMTE